MATFKLDNHLERALIESVKSFTQRYFELATAIIENERFWKDWETSNPYRDIVDTGDLKNSGRIIQNSETGFTVAWFTDYVTFVYFGYYLLDGRRIPPRKWAELVIAENDLFKIWFDIIRLNLR